MSFSDKGSPGRIDTTISEKDLYQTASGKKSYAELIKNSQLNSRGKTEIDNAIIDFMQEYGIVGSSVAVAKEGKLVYVNGYGYANIEANVPVDPTKLFRIASVSKLITATAVLKLVEEGRLELDDRVFGLHGILKDSIYLHYNDKRFERITVQHLLRHTGGWSRIQGDPVFRPHVIARVMHAELPLQEEVLIAYALRKGLRYNPGTVYSYSNLGYIILGEIIEKVSGQDYEAYVKNQILHPLDIYDMHVGKSYYEDKFPREVKYYEASTTPKTLGFDTFDEYYPRVYGGNNIELLGAAGGWVSTTADLMKFVLSVDGYQEVADILSKETLELMVTPTSSRYTLMGWRGTDNRGTWWRTGTLTGSSALVVRQNNNIIWIVLVNTSTPLKSRIHSVVSRNMFRATYALDKWPERDLLAIR